MGELLKELGQLGQAWPTRRGEEKAPTAKPTRVAIEPVEQTQRCTGQCLTCEWYALQ